MNDDLYERGLAVRREVLGDGYVDRSLANADDFNRDFQTYVTQAAWGLIWTRPGLARRDRSLVNLAMLAALNRPHELALHVKAAAGNGVTKDEMKEVFLQVAAYAGAPAGNDAFRVARECFAEAKKAGGE